MMRKILPTVFTEADVDKALARLKVHIMSQMTRHGSDAFYSPAEGIGVIAGEYQELLEAYHQKNHTSMSVESMDVATGAVWLNMTVTDYILRYIKEHRT